MPCEMIITAGSCTGFHFYVCRSHCKIDMNILEEVDSNQNFFTSLQNNCSQSQLRVLGLIKNIMQDIFSTIFLCPQHYQFWVTLVLNISFTIETTNAWERFICVRRDWGNFRPLLHGQTQTPGSNTSTPTPTTPFMYSIISAKKVTDYEYFRYRLHTRVHFYYDR